MVKSADPLDSEIEVRHLHRLARVPFHITGKRAVVLLGAMVLLDLVFVIAYLYSALPEIRALTVSHRLATLDLDVAANLPTGYVVLKLYAGSLIAALMVFAAEPGERAPVFWYLAAGVMFYLASERLTRLDELWAAGIAVKLFGEGWSAEQYRLLNHGPLFVAFYLGALTQFPAESRSAAAFLLVSLVVFALAKAPDAALGASLFTTATAPLVDLFGEKAAATAWRQGFAMLGQTSLIAVLVVGVRDIQRASVRYIYHGDG